MVLLKVVFPIVVLFEGVDGSSFMGYMKQCAWCRAEEEQKAKFMNIIHACIYPVIVGSLSCRLRWNEQDYGLGSEEDYFNMAKAMDESKAMDQSKAMGNFIQHSKDLISHQAETWPVEWVREKRHQKNYKEDIKNRFRCKDPEKKVTVKVISSPTKTEKAAEKSEEFQTTKRVIFDVLVKIMDNRMRIANEIAQRKYDDDKRRKDEEKKDVAGRKSVIF